MRFYFHFRDAKTIKDDLGEDFADIHAAGEHARRMARELAYVIQRRAAQAN